MTEFTVHMSNRPGQFAALADKLSTAGVHIEALALFSHGDDSMVRLMAKDVEIARRVLTDAGVRFEEQRVIETVIKDEPHALARLTKKLADANINIEAMYLLHANGDSLHFAVAVDDHEMAAPHLSS
ncbi:MAG: hypothetical protein QNL12_01315 [Acidimicrobiia bacterium]|nr:hypothetical protein [Acidimicrobiia bacterium]MDX2465925.1 hypothetical protein [Acidimicrobiia bacterium]